MNCEGCGRRLSWPNIRYYSGSFGGTEENHEKPWLRWPVSGPRFESGTSQLQSRSDACNSNSNTIHCRNFKIYIIIDFLKVWNFC
jgi:hypothetical protein